MQHFTYKISEGLALLQIDRPQVMNALNRKLLEGLLHFLETVALEEKVKALILTGMGEKAFISGADVKEMSRFTQQEAMEFCELGQKVANELETAPFVTIAAVNGYALGGGLEMALACDFIYASKTAVLGLPETKLGLIPGFGGTQRLASVVGMRKAKELIMRGKTFKAQEALEMGIVNYVCEPHKLLEECTKTAKEILSHSSDAVLGVKNAINVGMQLKLPQALELEKGIFANCFETVERSDAMKTFLEKRNVAR